MDKGWVGVLGSEFCVVWEAIPMCFSYDHKCELCKIRGADLFVLERSGKLVLKRWGFHAVKLKRCCS